MTLRVQETERQKENIVNEEERKRGKQIHAKTNQGKASTRIKLLSVLRSIS